MPLKEKTIQTGPRIINYRYLNEVLKRDPDRIKILITRKPPFDIMGNNIYQIWLTKVPHSNAVHPSRLHVIEQMVWEHLQNGKVDVILDAVEYLMIEHGVEPTLRFVSKLRDMALLMDSNFYVTVSDGLDNKVLILLKRIVE
ncbi:DUF835 domain-containing protein [Thermococcus sp. CX2]|uniref:DUF835 domain-containing protein n=1 Tax=Thermococcus sp. CX2 TaxID=163006 RepID=UPI00143B6A42|nr:DUF835 domain-containing protein [Thermococcus sp. CX2]NJE85716.1 DUF835 domain-containing protein [Thermococcus sp. CX2]